MKSEIKESEKSLVKMNVRWDKKTKKATEKTKIKKAEHVKYFLKLSFGATTNGAGTFAGNTKFDPSGCTNWSSLAALFDEFRVVGAHIYLAPTAKYLASATAGYWSITGDNDSTGVLASIDENNQYNISRQFAYFENIHYHYTRPDITKDAYWVDCASPSSSLGGILLNNAAASSPIVAQVWWGTVTYEVEFRSTR